MCVFIADEMEWMVELCGAAVVKDPLLLDSKQVRVTSLSHLKESFEKSVIVPRCIQVGQYHFKKC